MLQLCEKNVLINFTKSIPAFTLWKNAPSISSYMIFDFSTCIVFVIHLDIYLMSRYLVKSMYLKNKTPYNLERREYIINVPA